MFDGVLKKMAMEAREINLGNWLDNGEGSHYVIDTSAMIDILDEAQMNNGKTSWAGIPLTEEWLKRGGFNANGFRQQEFLNWGFKVKKDPNSLGNWITFQGFMNQFFELTSIQYVHQLQNLYFALTGEEIEFNG